MRTAIADPAMYKDVFALSENLTSGLPSPDQVFASCLVKIHPFNADL